MSIPGITANLEINHFKITVDGVYIDNRVTRNEPGILLIHATWCGHCKRFAPVYKDICKKLNRNGTVFPCVAIESEELKKDNGSLSNALSVEGFPTIKFFDQYGKIIGDYNGKRDMDEILGNICKVYHHCVTTH